uniref:Uncharacterized protein n=1 Tax=Lactuca sativa TaxID=4236 RepID=A0A9R1V7C1_LACSA|nr:hypothetical protein LSAT_V11C600309040 [Lactuca sativa]
MIGNDLEQQEVKEKVEKYGSKEEEIQEKVQEKVENTRFEDDDDFIVDQENTISDVDVDMADFKLNVDRVPNGFHVDDEPEEMEVINNEDWEALDEGSNQDRKRALITSLGKYKRYEFGEIHKVISSSTTISKSKSKEVKSQKGNCSWSIHASRSNPKSKWFIRTLKYTHIFLQTTKIRACTATFISNQIID